MVLIFRGYLFLMVVIMLVCSCKNPVDFDSLQKSSNTKSSDLADVSTNVGRVAWQKPSFVISQLGDIKNKTIADIGADSGYFAFRLAYKGAHVIAVDIDQSKIDLMEIQKLNMPLEFQRKFETRLADPNLAPLQQDEVDHVIFINILAYLDDPLDYLKRVKQNLKQGGKILVVDFKMKYLDVPAPSEDFRLPLPRVEDLIINAGYNIIKSDDINLEYQYLVLAEKI